MLACGLLLSSLQIAAVKNEALDVAAVVAQYQREVDALKAQLAALTGECVCAVAQILSVTGTVRLTGHDHTAWPVLKVRAYGLHHLHKSGGGGGFIHHCKRPMAPSFIMDAVHPLVSFSFTPNTCATVPI